jgi:hypothetical protein
MQINIEESCLLLSYVVFLASGNGKLSLLQLARLGNYFVEAYIKKTEPVTGSEGL